ncbi:hypothetical protein HZC32_03740, partial [Candidatus Woesearchaeota archaeon]|nr:hypothetical protein [Candidatus Woesearchaeota archaeon]
MRALFPTSGIVTVLLTSYLRLSAPSYDKDFPPPMVHSFNSSSPHFAASVSLLSSDPLEMKVEKLEVFPPLRIIAPKEPSEAIGHPAHGRLKNGVKLEETKFLKVNRPSHSYATSDLVNILTDTAANIYDQYTINGIGPQLNVYDLSREKGGRLKPHISHGNGL